MARITRDDIVNFQGNFGPRGAIIVIVGAVKADDAIHMVEQAFGDWENPNQLPAPMSPPARPMAMVNSPSVPVLVESLTLNVRL